jgi:hypothetical protein
MTRVWQQNIECLKRLEANDIDVFFVLNVSDTDTPEAIAQIVHTLEHSFADSPRVLTHKVLYCLNMSSV